MRLLWIVMICQALFSIALRGSRPIVSLYADFMGASPLIIGLLVSSFALLPMLLAIQAGKWLDQYGAKTMSLLGSAGMLLSLVIPIISPTLPVLFVNQIIIGISHVCVLVSLQKTVGNIPGSRDKMVAAFSIAGSCGEFIGPLITGYLYEYAGFQWTFASMVLIVIIGGLVSTGLSGGKKPKSKELNELTNKKETQSSTWNMLKQVNLRKALIISGLVLYSKDLFVGYFPIYGNSVGLSPSQIGIVISAVSAMAMVVRLFQFKLVTLFGRGRVMMGTLVISGIAFLFIPTTGVLPLLIVYALLLGAGLGLGQPLSIVYTLNVSPQKRHGEVLGLRLTFNRASQFVAPFIFGAIGQFAGIIPVFLLSGGILLFGSYYTKMDEEEKDSKNEKDSKVEKNSS